MTPLAAFAPNRMIRLLKADALNVARDATLIFGLVLSVLPAIAIAIWREQLDALGTASFGIADFSRYFVPFCVAISGFMVGWIAGFLFLDDRDDGPLLALDVTPLGKAGFMLYRLGTTALLAFAITLLACWLAAPTFGLLTGIVLAVLGALQAISVGFVLPAIARNKVEGLALTKVLNLSSLVPLLALVPSPLRYLAGFLPTFWTGELLHLSSERYLPDGGVMVLALAVNMAVAAALYRLNRRRAG